MHAWPKSEIRSWNHPWQQTKLERPHDRSKNEMLIVGWEYSNDHQESSGEANEVLSTQHTIPTFNQFLKMEVKYLSLLTNQSLSN